MLYNVSRFTLSTEDDQILTWDIVHYAQGSIIKGEG